MLQVLEAREKMVHLQSEMSCVQQIQKDNGKAMAEKDICIAKLHAHIELLQRREADTHTQVRASHVHELELLCNFPQPLFSLALLKDATLPQAS